MSPSRPRHWGLSAVKPLPLACAQPVSTPKSLQREILMKPDVVDLKATHPVTAKMLIKKHKLFFLKGLSVGLFRPLRHSHTWKSCYLERGAGGGDI